MKRIPIKYPEDVQLLRETIPELRAISEVEIQQLWGDFSDSEYAASWMQPSEGRPAKFRRWLELGEAVTPRDTTLAVGLGTIERWSSKAGPVSPEDAGESLSRVLNSAFNRNDGERMRASVPADFKRDDDLRLCVFIEQARQQAELLAKLERLLATGWRIDPPEPGDCLWSLVPLLKVDACSRGATLALAVRNAPEPTP